MRAVLVTVVTGVACGGILWVRAASRSAAELRLRSLVGGADRRSGRREGTLRRPEVRWLLAGGALLALAVMPGLFVLAALVAPVVLGMRVLEQARRSRSDRAAIARGLPLALDLAAAALAAGLPLPDALESAGDGAGPPFDERWRRAAGYLRTGGDPADAVDQDSADHDALVVVQEGLDAGMPLADLLRGLAEARREGARWEAEAAARRVAVRVVLPLAACFLPAFILLGVVPVVVGLFSSLGL